MTIDRRHFLRVTLVGAATCLPVPLIAASRARPVDHPLRGLGYPDLLAVLGPARVSAIGVRYREATPGERDRDALLSAIAMSSQPRRTGGDRAPFGLAALVARDFAEERTVLVDSWVLSITEARQCALFSLLGR